MWRSLALLACVGGAACGDDAPSEPTWQLAADETPGALLAVGGSSSDDVWVVGGRSALAGAPTLLHFDGSAWETRDPGVTGVDLWWVFASPTSDTVYFAGSEGTILRFANGTFERMTTPRTGIIFGMWGSSDSDLWAAGDGGTGGAILWRFDGTAWREVEISEPPPARWFKVNGAASDDVWVSGSDGTTLHWDGSALTKVPTNTVVPLFSVVVSSTGAIAVGGTTGDGQLLEQSGSTWTRAPIASPVPWRGVTASGELAYAVGESGVVASREATGWELVPQTVTANDFHAAWIDDRGALWAVGGEFSRLPLTSRGFLTYFGTETIPEVP